MIITKLAVLFTLGVRTRALKLDWTLDPQIFHILCSVHETRMTLLHTAGYAQRALALCASYVHFTCYYQFLDCESGMQGFVFCVERTSM